MLRFGLKLRNTRTADQILADVGKIDGVKFVKWEMD